MKFMKILGTKQTHCCKVMEKHVRDEKIYLIYSIIFREYGISILDGGTSKQSIYYCPWCGKKLPESLRDDWFDTLENMGFDSPRMQNIPEDFNSDAWWRKKYNL